MVGIKEENNKEALNRIWDKSIEIYDTLLRAVPLPKTWDKYSKIYDSLMKTPLFRDSSEKFLSALVICQGGLVHDGGCGTGYFLKEFLDITKAGRIIATDFSEKMLEKARSRISGWPEEERNKIDFQNLDLMKAWPEGNFDLQIFQQVANYLPYEGWKKLLKMSYKTTKEGGYVCSSTYIKGFDVKKLAKEHMIEQMKGTPITSFPAMIKSSFILSVFDKLREQSIITLPLEDEYLNYHKDIGFRKIEVIGKIVWGAGIVIRAQK
jgi:SAM-dependent methyltransferase